MSHPQNFSSHSRVSKVLIANRGEIALRVIKTCKEQGIKTVSIYSEADKNSKHAKLADESYFVGPSPSNESYLNQDNIIQIAKRSKANAIHPGYGFLSENANFASRCQQENLIWLGPPPSAISSMGSKIQAKKLLEGNKDIPLIPGTTSAIQSAEEVTKLANEIGFPVLLKASAGGGGKGMRVVRNSLDLPAALTSAQREALSSFGDSSMLLEKYFEDVKHIEVQIIGDQHGNVSHLFERECSVQRRHQKIIEEAPSSCLSPEVREQLLRSAIAIGSKIGYFSVGTVEFIYEPTTRKFYFLEVNTRLQVEHPVTEMITKLDLVLLQIRVAEGYTLADLGVSDLKTFSGHSIECRLCAEDPNNQFFPCTGEIQLWQPAALPHIRYDTSIYSGGEISVYYDPMIAKIISWGETREQAIQRMKQALRQTVVLGLPTNKEFLIQILDHSKFEDCTFNTHMIADEFPSDAREIFLAQKLSNHRNEMAIVATLHDWHRIQNNRSLWRNVASGWRNNKYSRQSKFFWFPDGELVHVRYVYSPPTRSKSSYFYISIGDSEYKQVELLERVEKRIMVAIDGKLVSYVSCTDVRDPDMIFVQCAEWGSVVIQKKGKLFVNEEEAEEEENGDVCSPMPSRVLEVHVKDGEQVEVGQTLLIVESMKMQNTYLSPRSGIVHLFVQPDQLVEAGTVMVSIQPIDEDQ